MVMSCYAEACYSNGFFSNSQPRSEISQTPVRQAHGPEVLEGKKFSLLSIRAHQSPLRSVYQQHTFSIVANRRSKCW